MNNCLYQELTRNPLYNIVIWRKKHNKESIKFHPFFNYLNLYLCTGSLTHAIILLKKTFVQKRNNLNAWVQVPTGNQWQKKKHIGDIPRVSIQLLGNRISEVQGTRCGLLSSKHKN